MGQHHVIIGGGPVGLNAAETIRSIDQGASRITLVCDEPAHSRMALPYWLSGQFPRTHTHTADEATFGQLGVEPRIGRRAESIDPRGRTLTLDNRESIDFDTLLLATGASPVKLEIPGADEDRVQALWTLDDTQQLLDATQDLKRPRIAMIGAGFIGFIMLGAMHKRGWHLAVVEREPHVLPRMLDSRSAQVVQQWMTDQGISLHCDTTVRSIEGGPGREKTVHLADGDSIVADVVIVATGIRPNTQLAEQCELATDDGILVDHHMRTSVPHIYAGGDVAQGPALYEDRPAIHAIQPTAVDHGRIAGANMAGHDVAYPGSLLMNVLDACGLQCASFGAWADPSAEAMTITNPSGFIHRSLFWKGDQLTGAILIGRASDLGMLTDVGMIKGILQTQTPMGEWKDYLAENPFDVRRAFVATNVARRLTASTLLGRPSVPRTFRREDAAAGAPANPHHQVYVADKR